MKKTVTDTPRLILSHTVPKDTPPPPRSVECDAWLPMLPSPPTTASAADAEQHYRRLLKTIPPSTRHLILPAPTPTAKAPWGLERAIVAGDALRGFLRAALRFSASRPITLLLPSAGTPAAIDAARGIIEEQMAQLYRQEIPFDDMISIGVTLDTPAALLSAASFCELADLAVIDTDRLLSLCLAAAPDTPFFEEGLSATAPAVFRLLTHTTDMLRAKGRYTAMGGRLAVNVHRSPRSAPAVVDALILPFSALEQIAPCARKREPAYV